MTATELRALVRSAERSHYGAGIIQTLDGWAAVPPRSRGGATAPWVWARIVQAPGMQESVLRCKLTPPPEFTVTGEEFDVICPTIAGAAIYQDVPHILHAPFLSLNDYVKITKTAGDVYADNKPKWRTVFSFIDRSLLPASYARIKTIAGSNFTAWLCYGDGTPIGEDLYPAITVQVEAIVGTGGFLSVTPTLATCLPRFAANDPVRVRYRRSSFRAGWWWDGLAIDTCT